MSHPALSRTTVLLCLALAAASGCGGSSSEPDSPGPAQELAAPGPRDVLLLTVDTLRQDHVSAYGVHPDLTPNLDALARSGARFDRHYAAASETGPSLVSLLSGRLAAEHGYLHNGSQIDPSLETLMLRLMGEGYQTAMVSGSSVQTRKGNFDRGFETFDDYWGFVKSREPRPKYRSAESVVDAAVELLGHDDGRPLFLWVHLMDPHQPYLRPEAERLARSKSAKLYAPLLEPSEYYTEELYHDVVRGYRAEVVYTDLQIGRLLEAFRAREDDGLVAMTSDHGEGLVEHDYMWHSLYMYEEQLLVPMILAGPGVRAGTVVAGVTSALDVSATLLEALGLDDRFGRGESFLELAQGEPAGERVAFAHRAPWINCEPDADGNPEERVIALKAGQPGGQLGEVFAAIGSRYKRFEEVDGIAELYDLLEDPAEARPLAEAPDDDARRLLEALALMRRSAVPIGASVMLEDDEMLDMLEQLGYR